MIRFHKLRMNRNNPLYVVDDMICLDTVFVAKPDTFLNDEPNRQTSLTYAAGAKSLYVYSIVMNIDNC